MSKWRQRFYTLRLAGLVDQPRSGRPAGFPPELVVEVKAIACDLPSRQRLPLSRFSLRDLAREVVARRLTDSVSISTIPRWFSEDILRPWQHGSWIFPRDPDFEARAARVLDLSHRLWEGAPLQPDEYVLSADEKTSLQPRTRLHPTQAPATATGDAARRRILDLLQIPIDALDPSARVSFCRFPAQHARLCGLHSMVYSLDLAVE